MDERFAHVGEIELCYETFGDPADPALLLVMGLGTQMIAWHEEFCAALAGRGFHVIRFDNRDIGRSTHVRGAGRRRRGRSSRATGAPPPTRSTTWPTTPRACSRSSGVEAAHVVGVSMGGMIAQVLAARRPERVLSLASIMSTTGARWRGQPAVRIMPFFLRKPPATREESVERTLALFGSWARPPSIATRSTCARCPSSPSIAADDAAGTGRQLAAIFASGDRTPSLARIAAPTVVVHGTKDRLVAPSGGRATAAAIPGARLEMIEGMGHDLPRDVWSRVIDLVVENARRARPGDAAAAA